MMSESTPGRSSERPVFSPKLSVVIGSVDGERAIRRCLESIIESCRGIETEIILVDASHDYTVALARESFPEITVIEKSGDVLVPLLWSEGIARARGESVALLTPHCTVDPRWARELISALDGGASGAGGPVALAGDASRSDAAIYFSRYSAFVPWRFSAVSRVGDVAGDNAMYSGASLRDHLSLFSDGFWEIEFHEILRTEGKYLVMVADAPVTFGRASSLGTVSRQRVLHGRHFGEWRVRRRRSDAFRLILGGPFVPLVLFTRIAKRVWKFKEYRERFISASPLVLKLTGQWSLGELFGALEALFSSPERNANRN